MITGSPTLGQQIVIYDASGDTGWHSTMISLARVSHSHFSRKALASQQNLNSRLRRPVQHRKRHPIRLHIMICANVPVARPLVALSAHALMCDYSTAACFYLEHVYDCWRRAPETLFMTSSTLILSCMLLCHLRNTRNCSFCLRTRRLLPR